MIDRNEQYVTAYNHAVDRARELNRPIGLEFIGGSYVDKLIPRNPAHRSGWELRCEVVNPTDPKY